jgi:hypothetical protein
MVEKKRLVFSKRCSAQGVLWICSGLSTAALAVNRFFAGQFAFSRIGTVAHRRVGSRAHPVSPAETRRTSSLLPSSSVNKVEQSANGSSPPSSALRFPAKPFTSRKSAASPWSSTHASRFFTAFAKRTTFFLSTLREPGFSQSAFSIYLFKRVVYKIVVVVNAAVFCGQVRFSPQAQGFTCFSMCWTSAVSRLHRRCTDFRPCRISRLLHIRSCGYAWVCPHPVSQLASLLSHRT